MTVQEQYAFRSVLLIDDSEIDVLVNRRLMELTSFAKEVYKAGSAEEALQFLSEECNSEALAPDWIFLDFYLPGMSGHEFLEAFASLPEAIVHKTRIIILSVFQKPELRQKMLEFPWVFGQLDKPLTQDALHALSDQKITVPASGKKEY